MNKIQKTALIDASATALYVVGVAIFIFWSGKIKLEHNNEFLAPIVFLLLFVLSAAFTSFFIFGRPALMYLDGKKKEALSIISYTLSFLFSYLLLAIAVLYFFPR